MLCVDHNTSFILAINTLVVCYGTFNWLFNNYNIRVWGVITHTEGRYGAGAGAGVVAGAGAGAEPGVLGWACFSSEVEFQGFVPGVLGDIGIVGVVGVTGISTFIYQGKK